MSFIDVVKGVFKRMFSSATLKEAIEVQPLVSSKMKDAIELWQAMYKNESPWCGEDANITSLGLAGMISSEKARTATIEMEVKVTGESERAEFIKVCFNKLLTKLRTNLEYGIALGGLVIKPYVVLGINGKYKIEFSYVKATDFYPITFAPDDTVTEAVFVDRIISKDVVYNKIEYHKLEGTRLRVINRVFKSDKVVVQTTHISDLGQEIPITSVAQWASIAPDVYLENVDTLLFAYFKMPDANTVDLDSPLGVSGFSKAVDLIKNADEQYSNLLWEFEGGQLAVDVDRTAFNPLLDKNGNMKAVLPKYQDRLFRRNLDLGEDDTYNIFSPNLRDANIINGLNTILTRIEDAVAISRGTLSDITISEARTATELRILKQRTYSANEDVQKALQQTLESVVVIIDKYCDLYKIVPQGTYEVAYKWDDSIIVDKDSERQVDLLDVNAGLLSRVEYRMKWMGETEEQAEEAIKKIDDAQQAKMEMQQEIMLKSQEQQKFDKEKRTNESGDVKRKKLEEDPKK